MISQHVLHIQSIEMSNTFYSRATGKLSKSTHGSLTEIKKSKRDGSTIYSIDDDEEDSSQYPTGELSPTQLKHIQEFVRSLSGNETIEIDPDLRGIHWVGIWNVPDDNATISCSFLQPHITACLVSPKAASYRMAKRHSQDFFENTGKGYPNITPTVSSFQLFGKYSIPLMDSLIKHNIVSPDMVRWSNLIIGQTQPIFTIISPHGSYECSLTFNSCLILDEASSDSVNVIHPTSETLNFTFRSSSVATRDGEGGHMTVHGSGIIQCQGSPIYIRETMTSFRECIMSAMSPKYASRLINSLNVVRKI